MTYPSLDLEFVPFTKEPHDLYTDYHDEYEEEDCCPMQAGLQRKHIGTLWK
jgi:hypothetical protein